MQYITRNELKLAKGLPPDNEGVIENSFPITFLISSHRLRICIQIRATMSWLGCELLSLFTQQGKNHTPSVNLMDSPWITKAYLKIPMT